MHQIRLLSPFHNEFVTHNCFFSRNIPAEKADALLCEWEPQDELLIFPGPKGWYNSEAVFRNMFNEQKWNRLKGNLDEQIFIFHAHPDPYYRVPMISFVEPLRKLTNEDRINRCVAIITNCGTAWTSSDIVLRNSFAINPMVDLYGTAKNWKAFMKKNYGSDSLPPNFRGEIEWPWNSNHKFETLAKYKAAICLENVTEPYYITEKFYFSAQTGCIPIYHAHPTVKEKVLDGAKWVDPIDFDFNIEETLRFAIGQNREEYAKANFDWLKTSRAQSAGLNQVYRRLGEILSRCL